MSPGDRSAKQLSQNALSLLSARLVNVAALFSLTLIASRRLGVKDFGTYSFISTVALIGSYVANFGLDQLMVREVSKQPQLARSYLGTVLGMKVASSLFTAFLIALVFLPTAIERQTKILLTVYSLSISFNVLSQALWAYGDAHQRMIFHSALWAASNLIKAGFGIAAVLIWKSLHALIGALLLAELASWLVSAAVVARSFGRFCLSVDLSSWRQLATASAPIALGIVFSYLYSRIDIILLEFIRGEREVGWYSAAYRMVDLSMIIPGSLALAFFPSLARDYVAARPDFKASLRRALAISATLGMLCSCLIFLSAEDLVVLLYGEAFGRSAAALRILAWDVVFIFIGYTLSQTLVAIGADLANTLALFLITLINVGLNLILIPPLGQIGASFATVASDVMLTSLLGFILARRIMP